MSSNISKTRPNTTLEASILSQFYLKCPKGFSGHRSLSLCICQCCFWILCVCLHLVIRTLRSTWAWSQTTAQNVVALLVDEGSQVILCFASRLETRVCTRLKGLLAASFRARTHTHAILVQPAPKYHTKGCSHSSADSPGARTLVLQHLSHFELRIPGVNSANTLFARDTLALSHLWQDCVMLVSRILGQDLCQMQTAQNRWCWGTGGRCSTEEYFGQVLLTSPCIKIAQSPSSDQTSRQLEVCVSASAWRRTG